MFQLQKGDNVFRWTGETVAISTVAFVSLIVIVYTPNPYSGIGFLTNEPGDKLSNMTLFAKGADYLVRATGPYTITDAVASPSAEFVGVPGFTATASDTAPTGAVGRTETGVAAEPIIGGRLVAQTPAGLRHYSSAELTHMNLSFGVALNSATVGGSVSVRRPGYVRYEGWGLPVNTPLLAGADGRLVTNVPATSFYHLIGRSLDTDTLLFQPESVIVLSTAQQLP